MTVSSCHSKVFLLILVCVLSTHAQQTLEEMIDAAKSETDLLVEDLKTASTILAGIDAGY
jgi:hypothetical protein